MEIPVLPPDINESFGGFTVVQTDAPGNTDGVDKIRFGLFHYQNLGEGIATTIIEERKKTDDSHLFLTSLIELKIKFK